MTNFMIKLFIKDYKNVNNPKVRELYNVLSSYVGVISNILLFIVKFIIGIFSNSVSIMADSFNNLSDIVTSVLFFIVSKLSVKPADKEHPFGHERIEYISGLIMSFVIITIGLNFIKLSIQKIITPSEINSNLIILIILSLTVGVKLWLSFFYKRLSNLINSINLKAISIDSLTDSIATFGTVLSVVVAYTLGYSIDGYIGIIVSLFIIYSGYSIAKETIDMLIGKAIDPSKIEEIKESILENELICGVHEIVIHSYGPTKYLGSAHVEIKEGCDIIKAHNCADRVEKNIKSTMNIDIVIHIDPIE